MRSLLWDILILAGAVVVVIGMASIYPPLGWLSGGAGLVGLGLWGARSEAFERRFRR